MEKYVLLFQRLLEDLETHTGPGFPCSDAAASAVACDRLVESFYKKLAPGGSNDKADSQALQVFLKSLEDVGLRSAQCLYDDRLLYYFADAMHELLGFYETDYLDLSFVGENMVPGPGASKHANNESFFTKYFQGPLSASSADALALYRAAIMNSPSWALAEKQRFEEFGVLTGVSSSLFFAPKNRDISRVCCTEPGVNMLLQRGVSAHIENRLKRFGISLDLQPELNKKLARDGSISDAFVTIDLSRASDSISLDLVRKYVPANLRGWLLRTRTNSTVLPDGTKIELPMVSTMGNGFTFTLQTAIFACVVRAVHALKDRSFLVTDKDWGVFGDDIIVRKDLASATFRLLHLLGFEVNLGKSFTDGAFRESCGGDYFLGHNVRGVYIRSLETDPERFSAINRLNRWSARWGILLRKTIRLIQSWCHTPSRYYVPRYEQDDCGIHVPSIIYASGRYRGYRSKQKQKRIRFESGEHLGYSIGLYVSLLGGYATTSHPGISDRTIAGRPDPLIVVSCRQVGRPRYEVRAHQSYWWDWPGDVLLDDSRQDDCWEAVVSLNLMD